MKNEKSFCIIKKVVQANGKTLNGCSEHIKGDFEALWLPITNCIGGPKYVGGDLYLYDTDINSLEGFPEEVSGNVFLGNTPLGSILFPTNGGQTSKAHALYDEIRKICEIGGDIYKTKDDVEEYPEIEPPVPEYEPDDEGGEIFLAQTQTNTTLAGGITVDSYQDKLRFFEQGGTARGAYIDLTMCTAGVGTDIIGGLSDRRRKNNIVYLSSSYSAIIDSLKPVKFEFKENPGVIKHGFIAQDVLEVEPELVYGNGAEENGSYRVDYDGILAMTVKSLQEALARIDQLEKTIKEIQG